MLYDILSILVLGVGIFGMSVAVQTRKEFFLTVGSVVFTAGFLLGIAEGFCKIMVPRLVCRVEKVKKIILIPVGATFFLSAIIALVSLTGSH